MNRDELEKLLCEYGGKLLEGFEGEVSDETMNTLRDMVEDTIAETLEKKKDSILETINFEAAFGFTSDAAAWDAVSSQPVGEVLVLKEGVSIAPRERDKRLDSLLKFRGILPKEDTNEQTAEEKAP